MKVKQDRIEEVASMCRVKNCDSKVVELSKESKIKVCQWFKSCFFSNRVFECKEDNNSLRSYFEKIQTILENILKHVEEYSISNVFSEYTSDVQRVQDALLQIKTKYENTLEKIVGENNLTRKVTAKIQKEIYDLQSKYQLKLYAYHNEVEDTGDKSEIQNICFKNSTIIPDSQNILMRESKEVSTSNHDESKNCFDINNQEIEEVKIISNSKLKHNFNAAMRKNSDKDVENCQLIIQKKDSQYKQLNTRNEINKGKKQNNVNEEIDKYNQDIQQNEIQESYFKARLCQFINKVIRKSLSLMIWVAIISIVVIKVNEKYKSNVLINEVENMLKIYETIHSNDSAGSESTISKLEQKLTKYETESKSTISKLEQKLKDHETESKSTISKLEQKLKDHETESKSTISKLEQKLKDHETESKSTISKLEQKFKDHETGNSNYKAESKSTITKLEQELKIHKSDNFYFKYYNRDKHINGVKGDAFEFMVDLSNKEELFQLESFIDVGLEKVKNITIKDAGQENTLLLRLFQTAPSINIFSMLEKYGPNEKPYNSISFYTETLKTFLKAVSKIVFFDFFIFREEDLENIIKGSSNSEVIKMWHSIYKIERQLDFSGPQYKTKKLIFYNSNKCCEIFGERLKMWMVIKAIAESSLKVSLESFEYTSCVLSEVEVKDQFRINGMENIKVIKL